MANVPGTLSLHDQFKVRYADRIGKYLSATSIVQERVPFRESEKTGEKYIIPILTRRVAGGDYALSGAGQVNFSDFTSSKIVQAELQGSQFFLSNGADWESCISADKNGVKSFTDEFDLLMNDLWDSARFRIEMFLLYGQDNVNGSIGKISGAPAANVITLAAGSFSPGVLYNLEGHTLTIRDVANLATTRAGTHVVTAVDPEAGTITVTDDGAAADGDLIYFVGELPSGSAVFNVGAGLSKWAVNAGSIAGIDAATNIVWKPTQVSVGNAPLEFDHILSASRNVIFRGHMGKLLGLIPVESWNSMMNDMSAAVRRTPQERKYVLGAEAISFFTGSGEVEIVAHPYIKRGEGYLFPTVTANADGSLNKEVVERAPMRRVGATDLAFVGPDGTTGESKRQTYFEKLQRTNLLVVDVYSHQALFPVCPSRLVKFTNITQP